MSGWAGNPQARGRPGSGGELSAGALIGLEAGHPGTCLVEHVDHWTFLEMVVAL